MKRCFCLLIVLLIFCLVGCGVLQTVEDYEEEKPFTSSKMYIALTIDCIDILANIDDLDSGTASSNVVPSDGYIINNERVEIGKNEKTFDIIKRVLNDKNIPFTHEYSSVFKNEYIVSINNISEKCCGSSSGWIYKVNEKMPSVGLSHHTPQDGDNVRVMFSCKGNI